MIIVIKQKRYSICNIFYNNKKQGIPCFFKYEIVCCFAQLYII